MCSFLCLLIYRGKTQWVNLIRTSMSRHQLLSLVSSSATKLNWNFHLDRVTRVASRRLHLLWNLIFKRSTWNNVQCLHHVRFLVRFSSFLWPLCSQPCEDGKDSRSHWISCGLTSSTPSPDSEAVPSVWALSASTLVHHTPPQLFPLTLVHPSTCCHFSRHYFTVLLFSNECFTLACVRFSSFLLSYCAHCVIQNYLISPNAISAMLSTALLQRWQFAT